MKPITPVLLITWAIAQLIQAQGNNLVDVSALMGKPAVFWVKGAEKNTQIYHASNDSSKCELINAIRNEELFTNVSWGNTIDLKLVYDVREIRIPLTEFVVDLGLQKSFDVYFDGLSYQNFTSKLSANSVSLIFGSSSRGRVVTVSSEKVKFCNFHVLVCNFGGSGTVCDKPCIKKYGIGCSLPCNCEKDVTCGKKSGLCNKSKCKDSAGSAVADCFYKSVRKNEKSKFIDVGKDSKMKTSARSTQLVNKDCIGLEIKQQLPTWLEWNFKTPQYVKSIEGKFTIKGIRSKAIIHITVDDEVCTHDQLLNSSYNHFSCLSTVKPVSKAVVTVFGDVIEQENATLSVCSVKILSCHPGFYGPFCRIPCNCLILPCQPQTGKCLGGRCVPGSKGLNCAQINLTTMKNVAKQSDDTIHITEIQPLFPNGPVLLPSNDEDKIESIFIRSIRLTGDYKINRVTVTLASQALLSKTVSNISLYTRASPNYEMGSSDGVSYQLSQNHPDATMYGVPCQANPNPSYSFGHDNDPTWHIVCPSSAIEVTIAVFSSDEIPASSVLDVGVWTCRDGTFGPNCDRVCNCRHPDEVCDKYTGRCTSKCAAHYRGGDCQKRACQPGQCRIDCEDTICTPKCFPGWIGPECNKRCPDGFFGERCIKACYWCLPVIGDRKCFSQNGTCTIACRKKYASYAQCKTNLVLIGHNKDRKEQKLDPSNSNLMANVPMVGLLTVLATIFFSIYIAMMCSFHRSKKVRQSANAYQPGEFGAGNGVLFKSIAEGWKWIETVNKQSGYHFSYDGEENGLTHIQKVAIWILSQDFDSDIIKRRNEFSSGKIDNIDKADSIGGEQQFELDEDVNALYDVL